MRGVQSYTGMPAERRLPDEADDVRLMERIGQGDTGALQDLITRYWARLVGYAYRILNSVDAAEDAVQESFLRIWQNRTKWSHGSVGAYLYSVVRNVALNIHRHERAHARARARASSGDDRAPATPHDDFVARALRRDVERAINALPERRREVFVLARYHLLSYREIAEVMGISVQTVANQMSAALADLRAALEHRIDDVP